MEALSIRDIVKAVNGTLLCGDDSKFITAISTNSQKLMKGSLFVPIVGERVDAHDFIEDAIEHGAIACFTSRTQNIQTDNVLIYVEDTKTALQALGAYYRSLFQIPVIGITGSVGKTTTKEMVAAALETKYKVLKTEGNMNSQVGLPLMMMKLDSSYEIAVIEMGMSEAGEMARLTPISKPEVAILTNIGVSHIAQLKTKENIRKEKLNIINEFHKDSILFLNGNDELLRQMYTYHDNINKLDKKEQTECLDKKCTQKDDTIDIDTITLPRFKQAKIIAYGTENFCDYIAKNIRMSSGKTFFTLVKSKSRFDNDPCIEKDQSHFDSIEEEVELQVLGLHNVQNALAALAVAEHYNIPIKVAKEGLKKYSPIAMRGQIKVTNGITVIDDSYNASPDSMKSGIQVLLCLEDIKRRIAVLADVMELGELSDSCHYEVGSYIAEQKIDEVVTVGNASKNIIKAIKDKDKPIITHHFEKNEEAILYLKQHLIQGDGVLVKGSRSMKTDEIVNAL